MRLDLKKCVICFVDHCGLFVFVILIEDPWGNVASGLNVKVELKFRFSAFSWELHRGMTSRNFGDIASLVAIINETNNNLVPAHESSFTGCSLFY